MVGSSVISSSFGTRFMFLWSCIHFDRKFQCDLYLADFFLNASVLLQAHLYDGSMVVLLLKVLK